MSASWLITIALSSISHSRVWQSDPIFWTKIQDAWTERDNIKNTMLERSRRYGGFGCNNYCKANTFCFWQPRYENFEKESWRKATSFLNKIQRFHKKLWKEGPSREGLCAENPTLGFPWRGGGREMSCLLFLENPFLESEVGPWHCWETWEFQKLLYILGENHKEQRTHMTHKNSDAFMYIPLTSVCSIILLTRVFLPSLKYYPFRSRLALSKTSTTSHRGLLSTWNVASTNRD